MTEDEIKGVQCFAFLAELMLDDEIGEAVRERAKGYPNPDEILNRIRDEAYQRGYSDGYGAGADE